MALRPKLVGVLIVVALSCGSRLLIRYHASKQARGAAVERLGQVLGRRQARDRVGLHHDQCFDQYYQARRFETDQYLKCVSDKVRADLQREGAAPRSLP